MIVIFMLLILGCIALIRLAITRADVHAIADIDLPIVEILTRIETNQLEQSISLERAIRYARDTEDMQMAKYNFVLSDSTFRSLAKLVDEDLLTAEAQVRSALTQIEDETHQIKLEALLLALKKLEYDHANYEKHAINVLELLEQGKMLDALIASEQVEREEDEFNKRVADVLIRHEMFTETLVKLVEEEEVLSMNWVIVLTLVFVILGIILAYIYSFRIWKPLDDIRVGAGKLGAGQLDTRIKLRGNSITEDIVDAFNEMADKIEHSQREIEKFILFSYRTAHDLKAPITNLASLLGMLDQKMPEANFQAVLNNAKNSTRQLGETVDALAKVNRMREELGADEETIRFEDVIDEVTKSLILQVKDAKATIKKKMEVPSVRYQKSQLVSIIQNLMTNSLKYRDPNKPLVIEVRTFEKAGSTYLSFADTGLGFDAVRYQDQIFKPFERLHFHKPGNGLGLYIIKMIVDFHGGEVKVQSEPKEGTQFIIRLN